tara:strand:+ start:8405 stop:11014 length:2610 start_codon:yes stop_codon:yes gene_type:complete
MDHGPNNCEGVAKIREALKVPLLCDGKLTTQPSISTGIYYKPVTQKWGQCDHLLPVLFSLVFNIAHKETEYQLLEPKINREIKSNYVPEISIDNSDSTFHIDSKFIYNEKDNYTTKYKITANELKDEGVNDKDFQEFLEIFKELVRFYEEKTEEFWCKPLSDEKRSEKIEKIDKELLQHKYREHNKPRQSFKDRYKRYLVSLYKLYKEIFKQNCDDYEPRKGPEKYCLEEVKAKCGSRLVQIKRFFDKTNGEKVKIDNDIKKVEGISSEFKKLTNLCRERRRRIPKFENIIYQHRLNEYIENAEKNNNRNSSSNRSNKVKIKFIEDRKNGDEISKGFINIWEKLKDRGFVTDRTTHTYMHNKNERMFKPHWIKQDDDDKSDTLDIRHSAFKEMKSGLYIFRPLGIKEFFERKIKCLEDISKKKQRRLKVSNKAKNRLIHLEQQSLYIPIKLKAFGFSYNKNDVYYKIDYDYSFLDNELEEIGNLIHEEIKREDVGKSLEEEYEECWKGLFSNNPSEVLIDEFGCPEDAIIYGNEFSKLIEIKKESIHVKIDWGKKAVSAIEKLREGYGSREKMETVRKIGDLGTALSMPNIVENGNPIKKEYCSSRDIHFDAKKNCIDKEQKGYKDMVNWILKAAHNIHGSFKDRVDNDYIEIKNKLNSRTSDDEPDEDEDEDNMENNLKEVDKDIRKLIEEINKKSLKRENYEGDPESDYGDDDDNNDDDDDDDDEAPPLTQQPPTQQAVDDPFGNDDDDDEASPVTQQPLSPEKEEAAAITMYDFGLHPNAPPPDAVAPDDDVTDDESAPPRDGNKRGREEDKEDDYTPPRRPKQYNKPPAPWSRSSSGGKKHTKKRGKKSSKKKLGYKLRNTRKQK